MCITVYNNKKKIVILMPYRTATSYITKELDETEKGITWHRQDSYGVEEDLSNWDAYFVYRDPFERWLSWFEVFAFNVSHNPLHTYYPHAMNKSDNTTVMSWFEDEWPLWANKDPHTNLQSPRIKVFKDLKNVKHVTSVHHSLIGTLLWNKPQFTHNKKYRIWDTLNPQTHDYIRQRLVKFYKPDYKWILTNKNKINNVKKIKKVLDI